MLELIKAGLWPAVVLIAIILFYSPIRSVLDNISSRASDIEKIKLGSLELSIKVTDLPIADLETAKVIVKLTNDTIVELLSITKDLGGRCYPDPLENAPYYITDKKLSDLALITLTAKGGPSPEWCKNEHDIAITNLGLKVKDYLLRPLVAQTEKSRYTPGFAGLNGG